MPRSYVTAPDRLGLALAAGSAAVAVGAAALTGLRLAAGWLPAGLLVAWPLVAGGIVLLLGMPWLLLHWLGLRGGIAAATLGGIETAGLWAWLLWDRWPGAAGARLVLLGATGMLPVLIGAGIAWGMWRIAYRRAGAAPGDVLELTPPRS